MLKTIPVFKTSLEVIRHTTLLSVSVMSVYFLNTNRRTKNGRPGNEASLGVCFSTCMAFHCTACSGILLKRHPIFVYFLMCNVLLSQSELEVLTRKPVCFVIFGKPVSEDGHHVCSLCFLIFINQFLYPGSWEDHLSKTSSSSVEMSAGGW